MICPKCKKENKDDYKFCYACGADLRVKDSNEDLKVEEESKDESEVESKEESKEESKDESEVESKEESKEEVKEESDSKNAADTSKEDPNKFKKIFLYKKNKDDEYTIAKTKVISLFVFVIFFLFSAYVCIISYSFSLSNLITCFIVCLILGLIFAVPVYIIGLIIRKIK